MASRNKQQGYTLIELMLAVVVLMGLIFTANFSYSLYTRYWDGRLGSFDRSLYYYQGLLQVKETIESALPYIVTNEQNEHGFYFLGRDEGFTLVTAAPIFAPTVNDAAVVRIFREQTADGYQLVYEEAPLTDSLLVQLNQNLNFKYRTVLLRTREPITFNYFGWAVREHRFDRFTYRDFHPEWSAFYDGAVTRIQPLRVGMSIGQQVLEYDLPVGHSKTLNFFLDIHH